MKKIIITFLIAFITQMNFAQTNIVNGNSGSGYVNFNAPPGTYIKDIDNTFTKFLGTWKWQEGVKILIFKLEKVTKYYYPEYDTYDDFIKGNYSYSIDGGVTYVVNTISQNLSNDNPDTNSMYSPGTNNQESIDFVFRDALIAKKGCSAIFTFLSNSNNQMKVKLTGSTQGYLYPEPIPNPNFSIPSNIVLTKQ